MFKSLPAAAGPPDTPRLRKTEQAFYELLSDLRPHRSEEFERRLWDQFGLNLRATVRFHICLLRKKLPKDELITTTRVGGETLYVLVRPPAVNPG